MNFKIFGCSLSHGIWWDEIFNHKHKFDVQAVPAGDNTTQTRRFQELILNKKSDTNDFILWQVTYPGRLGFRISTKHHFHRKHRANKNVKQNFHNTTYPNVLDETKHIDYVAFNNEWYNSVYYVENINQELQSLLFHLKIANYLYGNRLLVWFAQQDMFNSSVSKNFIRYLKSNQIDHIDLHDSIMTWSKRNQVALDNDSLHPAPESYKLYVEKILKPRIDENIKRNTR